MALVRGYILGITAAGGDSSSQSTEKIQLLENKLRLFKSNADLMRSTFNQTLSDKFNKSAVAILVDYDLPVEDRYLFIYETKSSYYGWKYLRYEAKTGKFIFRTDRGDNEVSYDKFIKIVGVPIDINTADRVNFAPFFSNPKKTHRLKFVSMTGHKKLLDFAEYNLFHELRGGNILPENIIYIS